jgi:hypothetical protein
MLLEWLENLVTPCSRSVRALGYLRELIGIKVRYRRCRSAWQPHLDRTKAIISQAISRCPQNRKAVILGSGHLLDIPIEDLAKNFQEVLLVDVVHPLGTRWRIRKWKNVRLLTADLTGLIDRLYQLDRGQPLPEPTSNQLPLDSDIDLVASVNLLSQLHFLPTRYLSRNHNLPEAEVEPFGRRITENHLSFLHSLPGVVALITDVERITFDQKGQEVSRQSAIRGLDLPFKGESWIWDIAPAPEASPIYSYQRRVLGVPDLKQPCCL